MSLVAGFQGITIDGDITTLGRCGFRYDSGRHSSGLNAECQITPRCGRCLLIHRVVPEAKRLKSPMMKCLSCLAQVPKRCRDRSVEFASVIKYRYVFYPH